MIGVLAVLVMLACCAAFILGLVVLAYPLKQLRLSRRWHGAALSGGAFVVFMIAGLGLPAEDAPGASPAAPAVEKNARAVEPVSVANADPSITSVVEREGVLEVEARINVWKEAEYPLQTAMLVEAIGEAIQAGAADKGSASVLELAITTDATDRLGHEKDLTVFILAFPIADLSAANFSGLAFGRVLNLSNDVRFGPAGARAILAYCLTERAQAQSQPFCALAESKV